MVKVKHQSNRYLIFIDLLLKLCKYPNREGILYIFVVVRFCVPKQFGLKLVGPQIEESLVCSIR